MTDNGIAPGAETERRCRAINALTDQGRKQLLYAIASSITSHRRMISAPQLDHLLMSALLGFKEDQTA